MYGGHVTDDWDRKLVKAYLETYMGEELLEGIEIFPGFMTPSNALNSKQVISYVETSMPGETPICFGLHPNAEIGFRLQKADSLFQSIQELQPRSAGSGGAGMSLQDVAKQRLDEIVEKLPDGIEYAPARRPALHLCDIVTHAAPRRIFVTSWAGTTKSSSVWRLTAANARRTPACSCRRSSA